MNVCICVRMSAKSSFPLYRSLSLDNTPMRKASCHIFLPGANLQLTQMNTHTYTHTGARARMPLQYRHCTRKNREILYEIYIPFQIDFAHIHTHTNAPSHAPLSYTHALFYLTQCIQQQQQHTTGVANFCARGCHVSKNMYKKKYI